MSTPARNGGSSSWIKRGPSHVRAGCDPRPLTIQVPDAVLADLRQWLDRVRWPDEIPEAGWDDGTDLAYVQDHVAYWREAYDWRTHEALLNGFK
jgi:hypothetical protein